MTEDTAVELAGAWRTILPRTASGKPSKPRTWESAIVPMLPDFERSQSGYIEGRKHGKRAATGYSDDARAHDYAQQYPDTARAMLLSLVMASADSSELEAMAHYGALLAAYDADRNAPDPFAFDESQTTREPSVSKSGKRREVKTLTRAEYEAIIGAIDCRYPSGIRNRAIIATLYHSGIRIGEALYARADAVDRKRHTFSVPAEGKRGHRLAPLPYGDDWRELTEYLDAWLAIRGPSAEYLFTTMSGSGGKMLNCAFERTLKAYSIKAGIKHVHPHMFRHTFATRMLNDFGWTMADVAHALGNTVGATAQSYLHSDISRVQALMKQNAQQD